MAKPVIPPPPLSPVEPRPIHFRLSVDIVIRRCEQADLAALEWFGEFTPHREIIEQVFAAQGRGEQVMLMAAFDEAPLGQVWIDLKRKREESTAVVWALRVFHWFHGRGIGTRLLRAAEKVVTAIGWSCVEIGVEHANTRALALYQRQGYKRAGEHREVQRYRTPDGEQHEVTIDVIALRKRLRAPGKARVAQRAVREGSRPRN
jgi:ribosomal protein S18 acetylase RimI-like enzyme